jgi:hypothetical protein
MFYKVNVVHAENPVFILENNPKKDLRTEKEGFYGRLCV